MAHFGELVALVTALSWTLTAIVFEAAGRKTGSLAVNLLRLIMAFILIGVYSVITRGMFLPLGRYISLSFFKNFFDLPKNIF